MIRTSRSTAVALALALAAGGVTALTTGASADPVGGALLYGLTSSNAIVSIRTGSGVVGSPTPVMALDVDDALVGIDVRPSDGRLYAVGRGGAGGDDTLYAIDLPSGTALRVGNLTTRLSGTTFGIDVNPVADALRVVSDTGQNLAVNLGSGAVTVQTPLSNPGLLQQPPAPAVADVAYTNSVAGASTTTLFDVDPTNNRLTTQVPATGVLSTTGQLTSPAPTDGTEAGFDIDGRTGIGYAALGFDGVVGLFTVALPTNENVIAPLPQATPVPGFALPSVIDIAAAPSTVGFVTLTQTVAETVGTAVVTVTRRGDLSEAVSVDYTTADGSATAGLDYTASSGTLGFPAGASSAQITVPVLSEDVPDGDKAFSIELSDPSPGTLLNASSATVIIDNDDPGPLLYGLTGTDQIARIRLAEGVTGSPLAISGLAAGSDVVGIDVRPATGRLYALVAGTSTDSVYTLDPLTGAATKVADLSAPLEGSSFAVDFNPVVDKLRVVSDTRQNLRVDPVSGAVTEDTDVAYAGSSAPPPVIAAAAYTNNVKGAADTALLGIDTETDSLVRQSLTTQQLTTVGNLGFAVTGQAGFDIDGSTGAGYALLTAGGTTRLYNVSTPLVPTDPLPSVASAVGPDLPGMEDITVATPRFSVGDVTVSEGDVATVTVTRTGDASAQGTVTYATADGTAAAGVDYVAAGGTLTFAPNQVTRTFTVATALDGAVDGPETALVTLTDPAAGSVLAATPATLTINDTPPSVVSVTFGPQVVDETAGTVTIPVTRTNPGIRAQVGYTTANGGATAGQDYVGAVGTVVFEVGETAKSIVITLLDDTRVENNESFGVFLLNPSAGSVLGQGQAVVTTVSQDQKTATSITGQATAQVQSPGQAVFAGRLVDANGNGLGRRTVYVVYAPKDDSAPFKVVRTLTTQDNGLFSTQVRPTVHAKLAAVYNGSSQDLGSLSATAITLVKFSTPTVTGQTTIRAGQAATFSGLVQPGNSRPVVKLQYLSRTGWVDLTRPVTCAQNGTFALTRAYANRGTFRLRVVALGTPVNNGAVSRVFTLTVT